MAKAADARRTRRQATEFDAGTDDGPKNRLSRDERFARIAKALGHPLRARIVSYLAKQEECIVGELASHFGVAQSTMSEHLRTLRDAAVVTGIIEGPRTCYCLDPQTLAWFETEVNRRLGPYVRDVAAAARERRLAAKT